MNNRNKNTELLADDLAGEFPVLSGSTVQITVKKESYILWVRLLDETALHALEGVTYRIESPGGEKIGEGKTDEEGVLRLEGCPCDEYKIIVADKYTLYVSSRLDPEECHEHAVTQYNLEDHAQEATGEEEEEGEAADLINEPPPDEGDEIPPGLEGDDLFDSE